MDAETIAFLDFETTGLCPEHGHRITEVGVAYVRDQQIVDRFQSLVNPRRAIPPEVSALTGISDSMVCKAPVADQVIPKLMRDLEGLTIVAHKAAFDRKFLQHELQRLGRELTNSVLCSYLLAKRVLPEARNHKLGTLVDHLGLQFRGEAHRALADAEMTAHLWIEMERRIQQHYGLDRIPVGLMKRLEKAQLSGVDSCITQFVNHAKGKKANRNSRRFSVSLAADATAPSVKPAESGRRSGATSSPASVAESQVDKRPLASSKPWVGSSGAAPRSLRILGSLWRHKDRLFVSCITCNDRVYVEEPTSHRWLRCSNCGFRTPQRPIVG